MRGECECFTGLFVGPGVEEEGEEEVEAMEVELELEGCFWPMRMNMASIPSLRCLIGSMNVGDSLPTLPTSIGTG